MNKNNCFLLTAIVTTYLMLVVLIALVRQQPTVACAAIGGVMTILTVFLWKQGDDSSDGHMPTPLYRATPWTEMPRFSRAS